MKIALIISAFYPASVYGGPIFSTLHLSKGLARMGVHVNVSTTNGNYDKKLNVETNKLIKFEENFYVKYYDRVNKNNFSLSMILNIWKDIKIADIVFLQSIYSFYVPVALFYAKFFRKPVLLSPRGSLSRWSLLNKSRLKKIWLRSFIEPFATHIYWHATSQEETGEIKLLYRNANVFCIPNGIKTNEFENSNILNPGDFVSKFAKSNIKCKQIIVSMSRLHKKKGFDILIAAFDLIKDSFPDAVLLIAGHDFGERDNLLQQIKSLKLEKKVFLIGNISGQDKIDFLSNADIFVLPSHNENFGNVYAEALAAATPIVASRKTPWKEIETYKCGYWVENSEEDISNAIKSILKDDYKTMGLNGKKYVHDNFDWNIIAGKFRKTFHMIASDRKLMALYE